MKANHATRASLFEGRGPVGRGPPHQRNRDAGQKQCQVIFSLSPPHEGMEPGRRPCPQDHSSPLTEMISAREMLGAMLRMKREQVLCSGRGLHSSPGASLGFSLSSSLGFSFSLSASSMQEVVGVGENLLSFEEERIEKLSNLPAPVPPKRPPSHQCHQPPATPFSVKRLD